MVEDGVAVTLSAIIIALVAIIILYMSGVFGSSSKESTTCEPCAADAVIPTQYDYTPGVRPFDGYSIKDTDNGGDISTRAMHWTDLWGKNLV